MEVFRSSLLLETRLESEFFEYLIEFIGSQVQKLWPKNNKLMNYIYIYN